MSSSLSHFSAARKLAPRPRNEILNYHPNWLHHEERHHPCLTIWNIDGDVYDMVQDAGQGERCGEPYVVCEKSSTGKLENRQDQEVTIGAEQRSQGLVPCQSMKQMSAI